MRKSAKLVDRILWDVKMAHHEPHQQASLESLQSQQSNRLDVQGSLPTACGVAFEGALVDAVVNQDLLHLACLWISINKGIRDFDRAHRGLPWCTMVAHAAIQL